MFTFKLINKKQWLHALDMNYYKNRWIDRVMYSRSGPSKNLNGITFSRDCDFKGELGRRRSRTSTQHSCILIQLCFFVKKYGISSLLKLCSLQILHDYEILEYLVTVEHSYKRYKITTCIMICYRASTNRINTHLRCNQCPYWDTTASFRNHYIFWNMSPVTKKSKEYLVT